METRAKKIKYRVLVPALMQIRKLVLGDQNRNRQELPDGPKPFFIMGSGRNGSTLLALLLNRHPDVFLPPEQYALPYLIMQWHLKLSLQWDVFCKSSINGFRSKNQNWILDDTDYEKVAQNLKTLEKPFQKPANIFTEILQQYASKLSKEIKYCGDHSPITSQFYKLIPTEFPSAKYIFLIRHPLDVVLSYQKLKNHPASKPEYACWKWNDSIRAMEWLKKKYPESVFGIKYENLVELPEKITEQLLDFMALPKTNLIQPKGEEGATDPLGAKSYSYHENLYKPISSSSVGKWEKELEPRIMKAVKPLIQKNARRFGYSI